MKSFSDFIQENDLKDYLHDSGVLSYNKMATFPQDQANPIGNESAEIIKDVNLQSISTLNNTAKKHNMGLDLINFKEINMMKTANGVNINIEINGKTVAKDKDHTIIQLKRYEDNMNKFLKQKKIRLLINYNKLEVAEFLDEFYHTPGNNKSLNFRTTGTIYKFI